MENIIVTESVKQSFPVASGGEFVVLHDISIQIPEGKLTILRGRSGSGKTTLMNILSALDYPKAGEVIFDGNNLEKMSDAQREEFRKTNVGFVFQSVALIPMMTAYENVEFLLRLAKYPGNKRKRAEECLKLVGLGQRMHHMPQELSGGEQQRVAIARAIAHKPRIIFADEPTAELDTATGLQVMKIFRELIQKEEVTIVMTTHDMGLLEIADCIYHLEDGEIINEK
ncbi:MAG: ABC transporter ATP-binding protein [Eubacterium sp.]|nr:ABC transporter ATP-binding protein [Eubacterium sp.]